MAQTSTKISVRITKFRWPMERRTQLISAGPNSTSAVAIIAKEISCRWLRLHFDSVKIKSTNTSISLPFFWRGFNAQALEKFAVNHLEITALGHWLLNAQGHG